MTGFFIQTQFTLNPVMPLPTTRTADHRLTHFPTALEITADDGQSILLDLNELEATLRFVNQSFPTLFDKIALESGQPSRL